MITLYLYANISQYWEYFSHLKSQYVSRINQSSRTKNPPLL